MDDAQFQEAYSRVLYLAEQGKRFGLVLGPPGSGKSELLKRLRQNFQAKKYPVWFFDFSQSATIVAHLLEQMEETIANGSPGILWNHLNQALLRERRGKPVPILLLDHLDLYDQNVIQELIRLIRFHDIHRIPRVFLAASNSEFTFSLDSRLLNRIDLKIEMDDNK